MRAFIASCAVLLALAPAGLAQDAGLDGPMWIVMDLEGRDPVEGRAITMRFDRGMIAGNGGCNQFRGAYNAQDGDAALSFAPMAATMMACPGPVGDQEQHFFGLLDRVARYQIGPEGLVMFDADDAPLLVARR